MQCIYGLINNPSTKPWPMALVATQMTTFDPLEEKKSSAFCQKKKKKNISNLSYLEN